MENQMIDEKTLTAAMSIIISAGDARLLCRDALNAIAEQNFALANEKMKEANKKITEATGCRRMRSRGRPGARNRSTRCSLPMHRTR